MSKNEHTRESRRWSRLGRKRNEEIYPPFPALFLSAYLSRARWLWECFNIISWPNKERKKRFVLYASILISRAGERRGAGKWRQMKINCCNSLSALPPAVLSSSCFLTPTRATFAPQSVISAAARGCGWMTMINKRWHTYRVNLAQFQRDLIPSFLPSPPLPFAIHFCFDPRCALPFHPSLPSSSLSPQFFLYPPLLTLWRTMHFSPW